MKKDRLQDMYHHKAAVAVATTHKVMENTMYHSASPVKAPEMLQPRCQSAQLAARDPDLPHSHKGGPPTIPPLP
jgi:hypothetical protein